MVKKKSIKQQKMPYIELPVRPSAARLMYEALYQLYNCPPPYPEENDLTTALEQHVGILVQEGDKSFLTLLMEVYTGQHPDCFRTYLWDGYDGIKYAMSYGYEDKATGRIIGWNYRQYASIEPSLKEMCEELIGQCDELEYLGKRSIDWFKIKYSYYL